MRSENAQMTLGKNRMMGSEEMRPPTQRSQIQRIHAKLTASPGHPES